MTDVYKEKPKITKKYFEFLKGKRAVVVAGAPHMVGSNYGDLIDSYDIVVRSNQGYLVCDTMQPDMGARTDILYTFLSTFPGCGPDMDIKKVKNIFKWIVCPAPHVVDRIKHFQKHVNKKRIPFHVVSQANREGIIEEIGLRKGKETPTTGMTAIYELLKSEVAEVYVTGFTFYKSLPGEEDQPFYFEEYCNQAGRPELYMYKGPGRDPRKKKKPCKQHPPDVEFEFFKKLYRREKDRVSCDDVLLNLMDKMGD